MTPSLQIGYSRVTEWAYAPDGGVSRQVLWDEATGDQVTRYEYGTTLTQSGVATSGLLVRKVLPTGDATALTYNRQGEVVTTTDANGSVHEYRRDLLGRATDDAVTTLASGVDGVVRRLSSGYDARGRLQSMSSHSAPETGAGVMLNEVKFDYNGIDCLTADIQSHAGAVDVDTPRVQYTCTGAVDAVLRRKTIVYPNGRIVAYEYGDPDGIDDVLNRVQSVHDEDLTVLAEFRYLGAGTPAVTVLSEPGLERRWKALAGQPVGDAGDPYTGYDRFGRVENMLWWKPSTSTAALQVGWGYDRASRRTWRRDALADAALLAGGDQAFSYDALSQVRGRDVGRLNTNCTAIGGIPAEQELFRYDEAGNWLGYELLANGAPQIEQTRVSNRSNQLVQVDGSSAGLSYDANGNMLTVPTGDDLTGEPRRLEWDAWNRLRRVYNNGGTLMAEYEYDAQARRIVVRRSGEEARQVYYNDSWRSVEERQAVPPPPPSSSSSSSSSSGSSAPVPVVQHVWQPASRWEMLLRDRATTPGGELDQRGYPLKDMLDVVALSDESGAVIERYSYSAFGSTTFMNASFEEQSTSANGWEFLFHAEFRDADTGWYNYGYRYYSTELGRWLARDPIGEQGGINFYAMVGNDAVNWGDRLGLIDGMIPGGDVPGGWSTGDPDADQSSTGFLDTAINWLLFGSDVHAAFSDYDPGWGPGDFPGFDTLVQNACSDDGQITEVNLERTRSLYDEGFSTIMLKGGPGRMNIRLNGQIELDHASGKWSFSGRVSAPPDRINFDPQRPRDQIDNPQPGQRGPWGEWITHQVNDFNNATGLGNDYWIYFDGDRQVSTSGCCPKGTSYGY